MITVDGDDDDKDATTPSSSSRFPRPAASLMRSKKAAQMPLRHRHMATVLEGE